MYLSRLMETAYWEAQWSRGSHPISDMYALAAGKVQSLMSNIGLAIWFNCLGITGDDLDLILEEGFHGDRADNNPEQVTIDKTRIILYGVL